MEKLYFSKNKEYIDNEFSIQGLRTLYYDSCDNDWVYVDGLSYLKDDVLILEYN